MFAQHQKFFVIPQNALFALGQNARLCGIRFVFFFLDRQKPNRIPDKIAFLQARAKKRFFRNDKVFLAALLSLALLTALPAHADQPEAREVARLNNCPPKKIEVYQNALGSNGKTVYQVTCVLPKMTDKDSAAGPDALLIDCDQSLCELIRPITLDKK